MLKVAKSGFCLQTDIHARQLKLSELELSADWCTFPAQPDKSGTIFFTKLISFATCRITMQKIPNQNSFKDSSCDNSLLRSLTRTGRLGVVLWLAGWSYQMLLCTAPDKRHAPVLGSCLLPPIREIIGARNRAGPQISPHYSKLAQLLVNPSLLVKAPMLASEKQS